MDVYKKDQVEFLFEMFYSHLFCHEWAFFFSHLPVKVRLKIIAGRELGLVRIRVRLLKGKSN